MTDRVTYVRQPSDLPPGDHFVVMTFGSITIPGDERNRLKRGA